MSESCKTASDSFEPLKTLDQFWHDHKRGIEGAGIAAAAIASVVLLKKAGAFSMIEAATRELTGKVVPELTLCGDLEGTTLLAGKASTCSKMRTLLDRARYGVQEGRAFIPTLRKEGPEVKVIYTRAEINGELDNLYQSTRRGLVQLEVHQANTSSISTGTGFFISAEGRIATNYHVIKGARAIMVKTADGLSFAGSVLARDKTADTALVELTGAKGYLADYLKLGKSTAVDSSSDLHVVGHPLSTSNPIMSSGKMTGFVLDYAAKIDRKAITVASQVSETVGWRTGSQVIDAPVLTGSSGSPLVNAKGEVVGMIRAHNQFKTFATAVEHVQALAKEADAVGAHEGMLDVRTYYWRRTGEAAVQTVRSKVTTQLDRAHRLLGSRVLPADISARLERFTTIVEGQAR